MRPAIFTEHEWFGVGAELITATTAQGSPVAIQRDPAKTLEQSHLAAATALARREGWSGTLVGGRTERGMVWVFADLEQLSHYVGTDHD